MRVVATGMGSAVSEIKINLNYRDQGEFLYFLRQLKKLRRELENGQLMPSDAADKLGKLIEPWMEPPVPPDPNEDPIEP